MEFEGFVFNVTTDTNYRSRFIDDTNSSTPDDGSKHTCDLVYRLKFTGDIMHDSPMLLYVRFFSVTAVHSLFMLIGVHLKLSAQRYVDGS